MFTVIHTHVRNRAGPTLIISKNIAHPSQPHLVLIMFIFVNGYDIRTYKTNGSGSATELPFRQKA